MSYWEACDAEPIDEKWHRCIKTAGHSDDHLTDRDDAGKAGRWPNVPGEGRADHYPCCSSHRLPMSCEDYRRTHFVEVRPCCSVDAERLVTNIDAPAIPEGSAD